MGRYRATDAEIKELNELIEPSSKTEEASLPKTETPKRRTEFIKRDDPRFKKEETIKHKRCIIYTVFF
jgi:23S rRNA pseudouridine2604 synthase